MIHFPLPEVPPGSGAIIFPGEVLFTGRHYYNFGCCVYPGSRYQVPADDAAGTVADIQVQVRTIHTYRTGKTDNFKMTGAGRRPGLIGKPDVLSGEAASAGGHPKGLNRLLFYYFFDASLQVFARFQPERDRADLFF